MLCCFTRSLANTRAAKSFLATLRLPIYDNMIAKRRGASAAPHKSVSGDTNSNEDESSYSSKGRSQWRRVAPVKLVLCGVVGMALVSLLVLSGDQGHRQTPSMRASSAFGLRDDDKACRFRREKKVT